MLFTGLGRSVWEKTVPLVLSTALGLRPRAVLFFFIRTSNFDAEAERSYIFWRFEAETFLKMFLKKT